MYSLVYSKDAVKQLKKLNPGLRERIIRTLERCCVRPYVHVKRLVGSPFFRLRVGDYRVILNIRENKLIILVLEIGHRRSVYK